MIKTIPTLHVTPMLMLVLILASFSIASAQSRTVSGVVKAENEALPGATVSEKGTTNGTVTDADGKFALSVSGEESVLVFSFIGMDTKEILVGNQTTIDVILELNATQLQDVVVVGYGTVE